jgi:hypothetical protein
LRTFSTESILFDVAEVNLPFNTILSRPALYQLMVVTHYGYLVLKMPSPNGVLKIREDRDMGVSALEKLQALVFSHEAATGSGGQDPTPPSLCQRGSTSALRVQPSSNEVVPMKIVQIETDADQTTRITGDLDNK